MPYKILNDLKLFEFTKYRIFAKTFDHIVLLTVSCVINFASYNPDLFKISSYFVIVLPTALHTWNWAFIFTIL